MVPKQEPRFFLAGTPWVSAASKLHCEAEAYPCHACFFGSVRSSLFHMAYMAAVYGGDALSPLNRWSQHAPSWKLAYVRHVFSSTLP